MIKVKVLRRWIFWRKVKVVAGHWGCWKVGAIAHGKHLSWILDNLFDDLYWNTNNFSYHNKKLCLEGTYYTITVIDKKTRYIKMEIIYEQPDPECEEYFKELIVIEVKNFDYYKAGDIIPDGERHLAMSRLRKLLNYLIHTRVGKHITLSTEINHN